VATRRRRRKKVNFPLIRAMRKVSPVSLLVLFVLICCFVLKLRKVICHHSKTLSAIFPKSKTESSYRIRSMSCDQFLKSNRKTNKFKDPNGGELILARANGNFSVSVYKRAADKDLRGWSIVQNGDYYQTATSGLFKKILENATITNDERIEDEEGMESKNVPLVIEVGASFGWFSLLSHKLGAKVNVFEPNFINVIRICQSLKANRWMDDEGGFEIYPYGVTDEDRAVLFQYHEDGTARINANWGHKSQAFALDSFARERGWLERNDEDIQILKIDVGNHAYQVFAGASELLESGMVKSVIVDLTLRHKGDRENCIKAIKQLMNSGYVLKQYGGEKGPTDVNTWPKDINLPLNILRIMERQEHNREMTFWWDHEKS